MKNFMLILFSLALTACGPSKEEQKLAEMERQRVEREAAEKLALEKSARVAAVTCAVISETRKMDAAVRVKEVNSARESIGAPPYVSGDETIIDAIRFGYCRELVLNEDFASKIELARQSEREEARRAEIIRLEREREAREIAAEERAKQRQIEIEQERKAREIEAEKLRIARLPFFCTTPAFDLWVFADSTITYGSSKLDVRITNVKQPDLDLSSTEYGELKSHLAKSLQPYLSGSSSSATGYFDSEGIRVNLGDFPTLYTTIKNETGVITVVSSWGMGTVSEGICKKSEFSGAAVSDS